MSPVIKVPHGLSSPPRTTNNAMIPVSTNPDISCRTFITDSRYGMQSPQYLILSRLENVTTVFPFLRHSAELLLLCLRQ